MNTFNRGSPLADLPITRDLTLAYHASLVVDVLMAVVSVAGLVLGSAGLYGTDPKLAVGVTEAEAGLLVPGLLGQDAFNLVVGLPILLDVARPSSRRAMGRHN